MATRFFGLTPSSLLPAREGFQAGMKIRMNTGSAIPAMASSNQLNSPGLYI
jgi:hypothetical protein